MLSIFVFVVFSNDSTSFGLHTHAAFPNQLAHSYDDWLEDQGRQPVNWALKDIDGLVRHIHQFNPPLLVLGGVAWEMRVGVSKLSDPVSAKDRTLSVSMATDWQAGDWISIQGELMQVTHLTPTTRLRRFGAKDHPAGSTVLHFTSFANAEAIRVLEQLQMPVMIPLVIGPPRLHLPESIRRFRDPSFETDIYQHDRFSLVEDLGRSGYQSDQQLFIRDQFTQFISTLIQSGSRDHDNIIRYWVLGNEPDSFLNVAPTTYARAIEQLNSVLENHSWPGTILQAAINGSNPRFTSWLDSMVEKLADSNSSLSRVGGAAINFYVPPDDSDWNQIESATAQLKASLARSPVDQSPLIVKEVGFHFEANSAESLIKADKRSHLVALRSKLDALGYRYVVWFNQMPTGFDHGRLIESAAQPQDTELGRLFAHLNRPNPNNMRKTGTPIHIPDPIFKAFLLVRYDQNQDGEIDENEAENVFDLSISNYSAENASDLTGLEQLSSLVSLTIRLEGPIHIPDLDRLHRLANIYIANTELSAWPKFPGSLASLRLTDSGPSAPDLSHIDRVDALTLSASDWPHLSLPALVKRLELKSVGNMNLELAEGLESLTVKSCTYQQLPALPTTLEIVWVENTPLENLMDSTTGLIDQTSKRPSVFPHLIEIHLNNTEIEALRTQNLFPALETLTIYHSPLSDLTLAGSPLDSLRLRSVNLTAFPELPDTLTTLTVNRSPIQNHEIRLPSSLLSLSLTSTQLTEIPDFDHLTQLRNFSVRNIPITSVSEFTNLTALETLDLSYTEVTSLPPLSHLKALRSFYALGNRLTAIPSLDWTRLQHISLSDNSLTEIPDVSKVFGLKTYYVSGNPIASCESIQRVLELRDWERSTTGRGNTQVVSDFVFPRELEYCEASDPVEPIEHLWVERNERQLTLHWRGGGIRDGLEDFFSLSSANNAYTSNNTSLIIRDPSLQMHLIYLEPTQTIQVPSEITPHRYAIPHVPQSSDWRTQFSMANPSGEPTEIELVAYSPQGLKLANRFLELPAQGSHLAGLGDWFADVNGISWIEILCPIQLVLSQSFAMTISDVACDLDLHHEPALSGDISTPFSHQSWNGVMLVNPSDETTSTQIDLYDAAGSQKQSVVVNLAGHQNRVFEASNLFEGQEPGSYRLHWLSQSPVWVYALHGDESPKSVLWSSSSPIPSSVVSADFPSTEGTRWTFIQPQTQLSRTSKNHSLDELDRVFWVNPGELVDVGQVDLGYDASFGIWRSDLPLTMRRRDIGPGWSESYQVPGVWSHRLVSDAIDPLDGWEHGLEICSQVSQAVDIIAFDPEGVELDRMNIYLDRSCRSLPISSWLIGLNEPWLSVQVTGSRPNSLIGRRISSHPQGTMQRGLTLVPH